VREEIFEFGFLNFHWEKGRGIANHGFQRFDNHEGAL
jgi:hypothetical protein